MVMCQTKDSARSPNGGKLLPYRPGAKTVLQSLSLFIAFLFVPPQLAYAVGSGSFENATFSARFLAEGNAGVAQPDEPASISYNPAGIVDLPGIQGQTNWAFISLITRHSRNDSSTYGNGTVAVVPTGYMTVNPGKLLNDRLAFGIGSDSPFGFLTKYDSNHPISHYTGYRNWLKMFTIKPVMAVKVNKWLSIGGGPMWYRAYDFGSILAYPNKLPQVAGLIPGPPVLPFFPDGQLRAEMSGNSWGWQLGVLLKPHRKHQLGFYFRSPVHMKLKGRVKVENAFNPFNPAFQKQFETGAHVKMNLPLNMTFGYAFKPNDRAAIEMDFGFTRWAAFRRLYIDTDPVNAIDDAILGALGMIDADYRNSYSLHLGGHYKTTDKLTLRGGWHYYWTPVPKFHFRPAIPDSNSMGLAVGLSYEAFKNTLLDLVYYNRFWWRRHIDNDLSEVLGTSVDGKYFTYGQELIVSLTYRFDPFPKSSPEPQGTISVVDATR